MHPAAERVLDLVTTPRNTSELLSASRAAWNTHGYQATYCAFSALVSFADNFAGPREEGYAHVVLIPQPADEVLAFAGSQSRGEQAFAAIDDYLGRFLEANNGHARRLAPGATLEQIDRDFKGNAVFLMAHMVGAGLMTMAADGRDSEAVHREVRSFLEDLSA